MRIKDDVRLSQCLIVKDEEKNIEQALSWGKGIVYEQIVVDTGSTDRTVELAESMGAKVYHFQWIDDFAAAKNFAISKASGDWIAFLDADEYFLPEDTANLMPLLNELNKTPYHVMLTSWLHLNRSGKIFAGGSQARIFRHIPGLQYRNRIHEELALNGMGVIGYTVDATQELAIYHTGYATDVAEDKQKGARNARLILMELEDHPDNYEMMGYLADAYYSEGEDLDKAEEWYRKSIDLLPDQVDEYDIRTASTFWKLMTILQRGGEEEPLMKVYEQAIRFLPKESDFDYIAGRFYTERKDFRKGAYHLGRALEILEEHGCVNRGQLISGQLQGTWELLAMCHYQNGNLDQCVKCCVNLLKADRYLMSTLIIMLCAFRSNQVQSMSYHTALESGAIRKTPDAAETAAFLGNLYDMNQLKDRIFLLRAAMEAEYRDLIRIIRGTCSAEELACFDRSMEQRR